MIDLESLTYKIKNISPAELEMHGVITAAPKKAGGNPTFICPFCGNGTGKSGDGLVPKEYHWGWNYECFSENKGYDNIALLAEYYGLNTTGADFVELCKRAASDFGITADNDNYSADDFVTYHNLQPSPAPSQKTVDEIERIKKDIAAAQKNGIPSDLSDKDLRAIPISTYHYFNCGVINDWIHPKTIIEGKSVKPSRRLIIPTTDGLHYNAVLLPADRGKVDKSYWKMHAGEKNKCTFGLQTLSADNRVVFVTEGEIDAMSMYYAWDENFWDYSESYNAGFIATLGAASTAWYDELDRAFINYKPIIIFVADNDKAGRAAAEKHRAELLKRGYPAFINFFSDGDTKVDANDFLISQGVNNLADKLMTFFNDAKNNLPAIKKEIAAMQNTTLSTQNKTAAAQEENIEVTKEIVRKLADNLLNEMSDADFLQKIFHLSFGDLDNAKRLFLLFGKYIRYVNIAGEWRVYLDGVWKGAGKADSIIYPFWLAMAKRFETCRPKYHYISTPTGIKTDTGKPQPKDIDEVKISDGLLKKLKEESRMKKAINVLKGYVIAWREDFDKDPLLLNVKNGTIDLKTGKFYPHNPKQLLTKQCNVIYNPAARAPLFEEFMKQILPDDETRAAMLRYLGYCLTGLVNEEKVFFAYGKGGNGKGTLFGTIQYLLGDYATSFKIENLLKRKFGNNPDAASPEIAKLNGARYVVVSESKDVRQFDTATLKDFTGGDRITARAMYQSPITFFPTHKFILQGNNLPTPENINDAGFLRRFYIIIFEKSFAKNPNLHLKEELLAADSLSGILNILIAECLEWQKEGLIISAAMKAAKEEYRADNDFIANFIAENCELDSGSYIGRKDFLTRLREEYHISKLQYKDKELIELITAIDGITEKSEYKGRAKCFWGVKWLDDELSTDDKFCPPPNM